MAPDIATQERIYDALKSDLLSATLPLGLRIDLQRLADRHRASTTPVREAVYRLIGERLIEPHPDGGFRVVVPDATGLLHLYAWNANHLLSALHMTREISLREAVEPLGRRRSAETPLDQAIMVSAFFASIGHATGNAEYVARIVAANERLHIARIAEAKFFGDGGRELRGLTRLTGSDVQKNVRRRIMTYHRRRADHVAQIVALLRSPMMTA